MTDYYHGSPNKFKKFTFPKTGRDYGTGIYLTIHIDEAIQYALSTDKNGYLYKVALPPYRNPFDTTNRAHAAILKVAIRKHSPQFIENEDDRFAYMENSDSGFDQSMSYSLYHQVRSAFKLDHRDSEDINLILYEAGFDSILDPVKGWLVVLRPESLKIITSEPIKISQYEFIGEPSEMKFIKKVN